MIIFINTGLNNATRINTTKTMEIGLVKKYWNSPVWTDKITEKGGKGRDRMGRCGKTQEYQGIAGTKGGTESGNSHIS